jgi:hypothetical protein
VCEFDHVDVPRNKKLPDVSHERNVLASEVEISPESVMIEETFPKLYSRVSLSI